LDARRQLNQVERIIKLLDENCVFHDIEPNRETGSIRSMVALYPESLKAYKSTLIGLIIDTTFLTNIYGIEILNIVARGPINDTI
jgi:hypothetical protein